MFESPYSFENLDVGQNPAWLNWFLSLPLVIQIAVVSILISTCFILYIQYRIWYIRFKNYIYNKRVKYIVPILDDLITEQIVLKSNVSQNQFGEPAFNIPNQIRAEFRSRKYRKIIIDRIIKYQADFTGTIGTEMRNLYMELGLDKVSFRKMKSRKWEKKIRGIRELTNMDILIADVNILPLTNNKRQELRSEARNAYIKLSKNEPFKFFDVTTEPLLKWDQIELFKTITTTENIAIPNFARWVTYSNNKSVVAFCMELIVYYKQYDAAPAVVKLLENKDHLLRAQAINCLGKLKYEQAAPQLVHIYSNQPLNCRLEILKALGRMGNKENVTFLKQEFMYSTDFDIRKNAAKSIVRNSNKQQIDLLMESCTPENQLILKHNLNPLIKY